MRLQSSPFSRISSVLASAIALSACAADPEPVALVLVPPNALAGEIDAELAIEGLSALLVARLRALPEVSVQIDRTGCEHVEAATHELRITRDLTPTSALTGLQLRACNGATQHVEQLVQPREARRDWSAEVAWWVGSQLRAPPARPAIEAAVDETQMQRFLVAVALLKRRTPVDVRDAAAELNALTAAAPGFAQAHAYHAAAQMLASEFGLLSLSEALTKADASIDSALALAPDLGMALAARGLYYMNLDRYAEAVPELARAAARDPGDATILLWLGNALLYHGEPSAAQPWLARAKALDPTLVSIDLSLAEAACLAGKDEVCERFLANPGPTPMAQFMAALLLAHQGQFETSRKRLDALSDGVNRDWLDALRMDLCRLLEDSVCAPPALMAADGDSVPPHSSLPVRENPILDLWRIDLGLSSWVLAARNDGNRRQQLLAELRRMREGGLAIPLLDLIDACLVEAPPGHATALAKIWQPMLDSWACPLPGLE
jgi:tetratricopeptide (TPR) repeat protein